MVDARPGATYEVEPDFASRQAVIWSILWLVGAVTFGLYARLLLVLPDLDFGQEFLSYGRIHAAADTMLVFGWLTTAAFAAIFVLVPRVCEVQLHNEVLGAAATLFWGFVLVGGVGTLLGGLNSGKALAELPALVDVALFGTLALVLYNAGVTAARRREQTLYPSAWYLLGAVMVLPVIYAVGNLPVFTGITDAIVSAFYVNALELLWFLPVGLGVAYYVVPVETGNPLASPQLARIGFWALALAGGWAGGRFLVGAPVPDYLPAIGVAMTIVLLVPVLSTVSNLYATGKGRWGLLGQAFGLRWVAVGLGLLVLWAVLLIASSLPHLAQITGLTLWAEGVRHLGYFGVFSAFAFGLIYRSYPLLVGRAWYSERLASFHFWATLVGVGIGTVVLMLAGAVQGTAAATWAQATDGGFADLVQWIAFSQHGFHILAAAAFFVVFVAQWAFAWNAYRTAQLGPLVQIGYAAPQVAGRTA